MDSTADAPGTVPGSPVSPAPKPWRTGHVVPPFPGDRRTRAWRRFADLEAAILGRLSRPPDALDLCHARSLAASLVQLERLAELAAAGRIVDTDARAGLEHSRDTAIRYLGVASARSEAEKADPRAALRAVLLEHEE